MTNLALEASRRARLYKATRFAMHFLQLLFVFYCTNLFLLRFGRGTETQTHSYEIVAVKNQAQLLSTLDCQSEIQMDLCCAVLSCHKDESLDKPSTQHSQSGEQAKQLAGSARRAAAEQIAAAMRYNL